MLDPLKTRSGLATMQDVGGTEYFLLVGGRTRSPDLAATASIHVIPANGTFEFVTPLSSLVKPRIKPVCATTSDQRLVCIGGSAVLNFVTEYYSDDVESCSIDIRGVVLCSLLTTQFNTYHGSTSSSIYNGIVALGPFLLTVATERTTLTASNYRSYLRVFDPATVTDSGYEYVDLLELPYWWYQYSGAGSDNMAVMGGGEVFGLLNSDLRNVSFVSCPGGCARPLQGASSSGTGTSSSSSSLATTTAASATTTATAILSTSGNLRSDCAAMVAFGSYIFLEIALVLCSVGE